MHRELALGAGNTIQPKLEVAANQGDYSLGWQVGLTHKGLAVAPGSQSKGPIHAYLESYTTDPPQASGQGYSRASGASVEGC